jgi:hypothetical protein
MIINSKNKGHISKHNIDFINCIPKDADFLEHFKEKTSMDRTIKITSKNYPEQPELSIGLNINFM